MKRLNNLWPRVVAFDNLWLAWRKARRGKSRRAEVVDFELNLEHNLLRLQRELMTGGYLPGGYRLFTVYERKPRLIAAAPLHDRVVHHAVMNIIEPPLDRRFIHDSYACRAGKGTHRAVARYQSWAQRYAYALKLDVQQYFPSIDLAILKEKLRHWIRDKHVLQLLDLIIDGSPATMPQKPVYFPGDDLFTPLERRHVDHWIQDQLRARAYLRYVDDLVLLDDDKGRLGEWREALEEQMTRERLRLHPRDDV